MICLSPLQTEAESLAENWCFSLEVCSCLLSLTALLNLIFDSLNLPLSPLLNTSTLSNLSLLSFAVNQGLGCWCTAVLTEPDVCHRVRELIQTIGSSMGGLSYRRYRRSPRAPQRGAQKNAKKKKSFDSLKFVAGQFFFCAPFFIANQYFDIQKIHLTLG